MKARNAVLNTITILGLVASASPVYSTTTEYSSRSSWLAAVSGVTTTTFDTAVAGYTPPGPDGFLNLASGGITLNDMTFQGYGDTNPTPYALTVINGGPSLGQYYNWGTGGAILTGDQYQGALAHLHISFATAVTAWGTDLMTSAGSGTYSIQINGGVCPTACLAPTFAFPTAAFFGMTSTTGFNVVDLFVPINTRPELDNFSTATANVGAGDPGGGDPGGGETPEVGTILLCATGLVSLAKLRKLFHLQHA